MLIFLAFLVLAIIVIAVIYMLATQTGGSNGETPTPSATVSAAVSPSPSETVEPTPSPSPTDEGTVTLEETAEGTKYNITVPGGFVSYSVVADKTVFEHSRDDGSDTFMDVSEAGEYLSISFLIDTKAMTLAPNYLDQFINYNEFEQTGEEYIPGTEIAGERVAANDGNTQFEAWLVDTDKGVLAVMISYNLADKDAQITKLNKILGTFTMSE